MLKDAIKRALDKRDEQDEAPLAAPSRAQLRRALRAGRLARTPKDRAMRRAFRGVMARSTARQLGLDAANGRRA